MLVLKLMMVGIFRSGRGGRGLPAARMAVQENPADAPHAQETTSRRTCSPHTKKSGVDEVESWDRTDWAIRDGPGHYTPSLTQINDQLDRQREVSVELDRNGLYVASIGDGGVCQSHGVGKEKYAYR